MHEVGQGIYLYESHQLGAFSMIASNLVQSIGNTFELGCGFGFDKKDGDTVDEEGDIEANPVSAIEEPEFVGHVVGVLLPVLGKEADILFSLLLGNECRFKAAEELPGFEVTFDSRQDVGETPSEILSPREIEEAGVEALGLSKEHILEQKTLFASP